MRQWASLFKCKCRESNDSGEIVWHCINAGFRWRLVDGWGLWTINLGGEFVGKKAFSFRKLPRLRTIISFRFKNLIRWSLVGNVVLGRARVAVN